MASTVLPNGIIIPEKFSRDWYADLYHNWQELDNLLGGGTPKDGTLTIQKNGSTVGTFSANQSTDETINITVPDVNNGTLTIQKNSTTIGTFGANQATDETINIEVPDVNNGTLTIQQNGTTVDTFTANSSSDKTVDITVPTKTSDLTNDSNFVPSTDLATVATSGSYTDLSDKPTIPTVNNATLTIQQNGTTVDTFTANSSSDKTVNISVPTKTSDLNNDSGFITGVTWDDVTNKPSFATVATSGSYNDLSNKPTIPTVNNGTLTIQQNGTTVDTFTANSSSDKTVNIQCVDLTNNQTVGGIKTFSNAPVVGSINLDGKTIDTDANGNMTFNGNKVLTDSNLLESLGANSIPFHNAYPRCKYLGTTITDAQNTAIKNRTYDDLFIGDYWTINGVNWRIVAIDYYYNIGDTNFDKGNVIVMPDTVLYNAQMNETNTTAGAYGGSLMRTQNLNNARTIAQNAFGSHLANHRIMLASAVDSSGPSDWSWYDSDGVELPNEVQIYGTRVWGSALKGFDVGTQKQQFPLMLFAPQFVNIRQDYWLQDVSSDFVSDYFALANDFGRAAYYYASISLGVRPSVTLSYI